MFVFSPLKLFLYVWKYFSKSIHFAEYPIKESTSLCLSISCNIQICPLKKWWIWEIRVIRRSAVHSSMMKNDYVEGSGSGCSSSRHFPETWNTMHSIPQWWMCSQRKSGTDVLLHIIFERFIWTDNVSKLNDIIQTDLNLFKKLIFWKKIYLQQWYVNNNKFIYLSNKRV